eukprot:1340118-Amorphochlora_amoeboformis.AAC.1
MVGILSPSRWRRVIRGRASLAAAVGLAGGLGGFAIMKILRNSVRYVGHESAVEYLLEGIHILQNRGYDSAGVATIDEDSKINITK